ncbi:hypothetical protein Sango_0074400 [Sesamum angolense]|uniref:Transmembrane protein n=1 Tax=Sesamum angolense TaxID=2727404 RepID=A0AAE2C5R0_9LAMI|nr:hypothetical protein Sango_0074400 [Sesamum angolense]
MEESANGRYVRVVKETDLKSVGLRPRSPKQLVSERNLWNEASPPSQTCETAIASWLCLHLQKLSVSSLYLAHFHQFNNISSEFAKKRRGKMSDWGPVFVAVVLFVLLTPGLLIQIPGRSRIVEFGNFQTSGVSILVHAILYFALICIFLLAIGIHVYVGQ